MKRLTLSFNFGEVVFAVYGDHVSPKRIGELVRETRGMVPDPYQVDVDLDDVPDDAHRLERERRTSTCTCIRSEGSFTKYLTPQRRYHYLSRLH